jgi:hypothetical protein
MGSGLEYALDLQCEPPTSFATALPLTMGLATGLRIQLWQYVQDYPSVWSFPDRVLVWLLPTMEDDVAKFYRDRRKSMVDLFNEYQLERIDGALFRQLTRQIKSTSPTLLYLLVDVARSIQEAARYPRKWHEEVSRILDGEESS